MLTLIIGQYFVYHRPVEKTAVRDNSSTEARVFGLTVSHSYVAGEPRCCLSGVFLLAAPRIVCPSLKGRTKAHS